MPRQACPLPTSTASSSLRLAMALTACTGREVAREFGREAAEVTAQLLGFGLWNDAALGFFVIPMPDAASSRIATAHPA